MAPFFLRAELCLSDAESDRGCSRVFVAGAQMADISGIDVGLALAVAVQAGGIIWWAATKNSELKQLNKSVEDLAKECKALAGELSEHKVVAGRLEERSEAVLRILDRNNDR